MTSLPHEQYPDFINPDGTIEPGAHSIDATLDIPAFYDLRALVAGATTINGINPSASVVRLAGSLQGCYISGGRIGVEFAQGSSDALLIECSIACVNAVPVYIYPCTRPSVKRCRIPGSFDNGIQDEGSEGLLLHSNLLVGTFANKAIDMSHGAPKGARIIHNTVVNYNGYGLGLKGWQPQNDNKLINNYVHTPALGPGASPYGIYAPNMILGDSNYFGNVIDGKIIDILGTLQGSGIVEEDMTPDWSPKPIARVWDASLRTALSFDLNGDLRIPWRLHLASGAIKG